MPEGPPAPEPAAAAAATAAGDSPRHTPPEQQGQERSAQAQQVFDRHHHHAVVAGSSSSASAQSSPSMRQYRAGHRQRSARIALERADEMGRERDGEEEHERPHGSSSSSSPGRQHHSNYEYQYGVDVDVDEEHAEADCMAECAALESVAEGSSEWAHERALVALRLTALRRARRRRNPLVSAFSRLSSATGLTKRAGERVELIGGGGEAQARGGAGADKTRWRSITQSLRRNEDEEEVDDDWFDAAPDDNARIDLAIASKSYGGTRRRRRRRRHRGTTTRTDTARQHFYSLRRKFSASGSRTGGLDDTSPPPGAANGSGSVARRASASTPGLFMSFATTSGSESDDERATFSDSSSVLTASTGAGVTSPASSIIAPGSPSRRAKLSSKLGLSPRRGLRRRRAPSAIREESIEDGGTSAALAAAGAHAHAQSSASMSNSRTPANDAANAIPMGTETSLVRIESAPPDPAQASLPDRPSAGPASTLAKARSSLFLRRAAPSRTGSSGTAPQDSAGQIYPSMLMTESPHGSAESLVDLAGRDGRHTPDSAAAESESEVEEEDVPLEAIDSRAPDSEDENVVRGAAAVLAAADEQGVPRPRFSPISPMSPVESPPLDRAGQMMLSRPSPSPGLLPPAPTTDDSASATTGGMRTTIGAPDTYDGDTDSELDEEGSDGDGSSSFASGLRDPSRFSLQSRDSHTSQTRWWPDTQTTAASAPGIVPHPTLGGGPSTSSFTGAGSIIASDTDAYSREGNGVPAAGAALEQVLSQTLTLQTGEDVLPPRKRDSLLASPISRTWGSIARRKKTRDSTIASSASGEHRRRQSTHGPHHPRELHQRVHRKLRSARARKHDAKADGECKDTMRLARALVDAGIVDNEQDQYAWDVLYEHQRGLVVFGQLKFSANILAQFDPAPWTDGKLKNSPFTPNSHPLPTPLWRWVHSEWLIDMGGDVDEHGWSYSTRFHSKHWRGEPSTWRSFVRRRRWIRGRIYRSQKLIQNAIKTSQPELEWSAMQIPTFADEATRENELAREVAGIKEAVAVLPLSEDEKTTLFMCDGEDLDPKNPFLSWAKVEREGRRWLATRNSKPSPRLTPNACTPSELWAHHTDGQVCTIWRDAVREINYRRVSRVMRAARLDAEKVRLWSFWLGHEYEFVHAKRADLRLDHKQHHSPPKHEHPSHTQAAMETVRGERPEPQDVWGVLESKMPEILRFFEFHHARLELLKVVVSAHSSQHARHRYEGWDMPSQPLPKTITPWLAHAGGESGRPAPDDDRAVDGHVDDGVCAELWSRQGARVDFHADVLQLKQLYKPKVAQNGGTPQDLMPLANGHAAARLKQQQQQYLKPHANGNGHARQDKGKQRAA